MATFTYIAKRPDGAEVRGSIDASSIDAAREELRKQGLLLEDVREVPGKPAPQKKPAPGPLPWSGGNVKAGVSATTEEVSYAPLHETLRIFAGWLLAWYGLIYALGFLEYSKKLPEIPFIHELFLSPLVLQFTFGTFLFLALSNLHKWLGKGMLLGVALAIVYIGLLVGFVMFG